MVKIKDKERAIIEFTCIPDVGIEKAEKLYDMGFKHLRELLEFSLDEEAKVRGFVEILNFRILNQFLSLDAEDIPAHKFKCPFCMGTVYGDEEECGDCGALLLEEILEVEIEDVYNGLREMIETAMEKPEAAKQFLKELREGDISEEVMEILTSELGEQATMDWGFIATSIEPKENNNYLIILSPQSGQEEERERAFSDFKELGAGDVITYPIEGGNIANKQEEAVFEFVTKFIEDQDLKALGSSEINILNMKVARFLESKATIIIEDNRHFLSSIDEVDSDHPRIEDIMNMLYDVKLIKEMRKIGENFILDGISFNNDPVSFFIAKQCIPILQKKNDLKIRILDVVVNTNYINQENHNDLVLLLQEWNKSE
jgi:hypothetical protein